MSEPARDEVEVPPRARGGLLAHLARDPGARVGAVMVGGLAALALVGPLLLPHADQSDFGAALAPDGGPPRPSAAHVLGTDALLRDELARLAAGGRISLGVGLAAAAISVTVGLAVGVGAAAAARRGARWLDVLLMRVVDVLLAVPFLLFVTLIGVLVGRADVGTMMLVLGLTGWTGIARVVRARALDVAGRDFVTAAHALGAGAARVALRHVLPHVVVTATALGTSLVGAMILAESVLGFLAVGVPPPTASWGRMLHEAEGALAVRPLLVVAPGLCIVIATLGFHRLGEAVRRGVEGAPPPRRAPVVDLAVVAVAAALVLALPAPSPEAPSAASAAGAAPVRGGTLRLASFVTARAIDPALASDEASISIARLVFGRLLGFDERGAIAPDLVTRWTWSADAKTLSLELVRGAVFHDGAPLRAADVVRSIERALGAPECPGASLYARIAGFEALRAGTSPRLTGVRAEGEHTVVIELTEPDATLPALLTMPFVAPVCPSAPEPARGSPLTPTTCGAGAFRVARFEPEDGIELVRHDAYHEPGLPYLDGISWRFAVRPAAQRYRFARGELDLVRELGGSDAALYRGDPRWQPLGTLLPSLRVSAIFLNVERAPFDIPAFRRAVALAVDPAALARVRPDVVPLDRVVPPSLGGVGEPRTVRRHDLDAALAAMAEAGFAFDPATGRGGYPHAIPYLTVPDSFEQHAAEIFQQQLARIGVRIELRLVSYATYLVESQRRGASAMGWAGWHADYPDPLTFFDPILVSSSIGEVSQNSSFFRSEALDRAVDEARRTSDPARRAALFAEAESIVHEEAPWIPTTQPRVFELRQPWLGGYAPTGLTSLDVRKAFVVAREPARSAWLAPSAAPVLLGGGAR